MTRTTRLVRFL